MKKLSIIYLILVTQPLLMSAICAEAQIIHTVAGSSGVGAYTGDGGPATAATLNMPTDVAINSSGNLFIADTYNGVIRKVNSVGIITTVAGGGTSSPADGGPATDADIFDPIDVAADNAGNIYIASAANILKVNASGMISIVAGGGFGYGGDGGPATAALLNPVEGITVDAAGNLYIADALNNVIRKVNSAGIISTVAGNNTAGFGGDGGPATNAVLDTPAKVAVDGAGNMYISDTRNHRLRKVNTSGMISTITGNGVLGVSGDGGPATAAQLLDPWGITMDGSGNLFFTDGNRIRKINSTGIITTVAGSYSSSGFSGDGGAATAAELNSPLGVAVDGPGNIFIADVQNQRIRKVTPGASTGINHAINAYNDLALFPNPNNGAFIVKGTLAARTDGNVSVEIINMQGQPVYQSNAFIASGIINTQITLDKELPEGIYMLRISSEDETHTFRLLIEK